MLRNKQTEVEKIQSATVREFSEIIKTCNEKSDDVPKFHLSPSQINMFLDCSAKYMFRYVFGIRTPIRSYFVRGRAIHKGVEHNFKQKIITGRDLGLPEVQEATSAEFDSLLAEAAWGENENPGEIKDSTIKLVSLYHNEVSPSIQPIAVEQFFTLDFEEYALKGVIDLIDGAGNIRDTKSKSRTPSQREVDESLQLTAYAMAYRKLTGKIENSVMLDNLIDLKNGPKYALLQSQRNELDIRRFKNIADSVYSAIKSGVFCPNPNSMMCSEKNCDFWKTCHETF